jgi:hypothetical protein
MSQTTATDATKSNGDRRRAHPDASEAIAVAEATIAAKAVTIVLNMAGRATSVV